MPTLTRPLGGSVIELDLTEEAAVVTAWAARSPARKAARTLAKEAGLRLTVCAIAPDGFVAPCVLDGPLSIHCLTGAIDVTVAGEPHHLDAGQMLAVPAGLEHRVDSIGGGSFLLLVVRCQELEG
jgi:quercetin dioxygenase-like cupin family protein